MMSSKSLATSRPEEGPAFRWLHLSDLHLGCPDRGLWWQVQEEFERSIRAGVDQVGGPPELILITGDLTMSGAEDQFGLVNEFLDQLLVWIREAGGGPEPVIVPIPGNHDAVRLEGMEALRVASLGLYGEGADNPTGRLLLETLWTKRDGSLLEPLFAPYQAWLTHRILPQHQRADVWINTSHIPGDLTVHLHPEGRFPLGVVGLNSAWAQYTAGNFEGKLELTTDQFHAALDHRPQGSPLAALARAERWLLLVHHPPSWLSPRARKDFFGTIYTPDHFAVCLGGHRHEARATGLSLAGGPPRHYFQAPSLFGRKHVGTSREKRAIGYAWGRISATGEVRIWPRVRFVHDDGSASFIHDPKLHGDEAQGFVLRPADPEPADEPFPRRQRAQADAALDAYCRWARERHRGLNLIGVGGGELQLRLDEVYVPLRISQRPFHPDLGERAAKRRGDLAPEYGSGDLELEEIFSQPQAGGPHVAIFGDPGAGKTTALVKFHHHCLNAGPESLGLEAGTVPVLLRLRRLREADLESSLVKLVDRELVETSGGELPADIGRRLWKHGRLLLLLDGLDEIADAAVRTQVCKYLEWQLTGGELEYVRAVVSCRYAGYGGGVKLDQRFLHLDIRPLDAKQCRNLVRLWFREVQRTLPDYPEGDARQAAERLIAALDGADYRSQRLKVLVGSPLLLTLLCVVVLRGGEMPRHRAAFYDQCLRVLLGRWSRSKAGSTEKDWQPAVDVDTALAILRPLAYALHAHQRRDDLSVPELVLHVEDRLVELGKPASALAVIEWLHREAGVLDEYAPLHYGFAHLGLQEYLAAVHIAGHSRDLLDELCSHCAEEWWREVVLLLVGLPGRQLFAPLMERLLCSNAISEEVDLIRDCIEEAVELDPQPFLKVLDEPGNPRRQAAVLRLLRGRSDPQLLKRVTTLAQSDDPDVAALARQMVAAPQPPAPAAVEYDVFLVHHPREQVGADRFRRALDRQGFRVVTTAEGAASIAELRPILDNTRGAALLVGPSGEVPWEVPALWHWLRLFAQHRRTLVPVLLPETVEIPPLPEDLPLGPWTDFRRGWVSEGMEELRRALAGAPLAAPVIARGPQPPVPGEAFTEPVTGERLLWIPGGRFRMGGERYPDERPIHWVRVSPFWLAETPVTNHRYGIFLEQTGHEEPALWRDRRFSDPEQPVVGVSWHDAAAYCQWLSERSEMKFVLPTEAQWEFAARGTDGREYPWGSEEPDSSRACFNLPLAKGQPSPVGSFPAGRGPFGVLDQAGNVWEWCLDAWDENAYKKRHQGKEPVDPCVEGDDEAVRLVRGGGWGDPDEYLRAAFRYWFRPRYRYYNLGFRVAVAPASL